MPPRTLHVWIVLLAIASLATTLLIVVRVASRSPDAASAQPPRVLFDLPAFTLTAHTGEPFGRDDLAGRAWVVNFIFTRCQGPCPMMTSRMAELQRTLADTPAWRDGRIGLLSVSVDPDHDTPEVLARYAGWAHAAPQWVFLTGSRDAVWRLIVEGFKLPVGEAPDDPQMPIFHSQKFVLVDSAGRVRGLYDGLEADGRTALLADLEHVLNH